MSFYLKINGNYSKAEKPKMICPGKCGGQLEILSPDKDWETRVKDYTNDPDKNRGKGIFICHTLTTSLRPLIPLANGFVFKEGSNLHHLANIMRHHNIPGCIDRSLWFQAINAVRHQHQIIHADFCTDFCTDYCTDYCTDFHAELSCGEKHRYTRDEIDTYRRNFQFFSQKLRDNPVNVHVFDMKNKRLLQGQKCTSLLHGQKSLSINALSTEGYLVPGTLILNNFKNISDEDITCDSLYHAIKLCFPRFGDNPGFSLMVRPSLESQPANHVSMSGIIHSSSVQRKNELMELIKRNVFLWKKIPSPSNGISLTIIIQELIPAFILGILFTCLPWEYHSNKMIFDLTIPGSGKDPDMTIQENTVDHSDLHSEQGKIMVYEQLTSQLGPGLPPHLNAEQFYPVFVNFLHQCLRLHAIYMIPLDIEFVITRDLEFYFVQFRHIFYPENL